MTGNVAYAGPADTLLANGRVVVAIDESTQVLVLQSGRRFFAVVNQCPHRLQPLNEASLSRRFSRPRLTCPFHNLSFDLRSGACIGANEARGGRLRVLTAWVVDGVLYVSSGRGSEGMPNRVEDDSVASPS